MVQHFLIPLVFSVLLTSAAQGVIVQIDSQFVAFNAELGSIDNDPSNETKFDVMGPDGGSFGDFYLNYITPTGAIAHDGNVSFNVEFTEVKSYTLYIRYREPINVTPNISLSQGGVEIAAGTAWNGSSDYSWQHVSGTAFTPVGTPGGETITLRVDSFQGGPAEPTFNIDAVAFVSETAINRDEFIVSEETIPASALSIPEPSSAIMLLLGNCLLLLRRRRA